MIILDTNVVSELMRPPPARSPTVVAWIKRHDVEALFISAVTVAEVLAGIAVLPAGRRRSDKEQAAHEVLDLFRQRCLPFDWSAAQWFATIAADRRRDGRGVDGLDIMIAATARTQDMAVATRNLGDFELSGVRLIDPWMALE